MQYTICTIFNRYSMINLGSSDTTPRQPRSQVTLPGDCTTAELMTVRETAEYL